MIYKPWPIRLIAILHILEPVTKVLFYSIYESVSPVAIIKAELATNNYLHIFEFFFMFPIAGFAILKVKKWSLLLFGVIEAWVFVANLPYLKSLFEAGQIPLLVFFILFFFLNLFVVVYLLIPAVRITYMDPKIRWWESRPRYTQKMDCMVDGKISSTIFNISETGIFIEKKDELVKDDVVDVEFTHDSIDLKLKTRIVHNFSVEGVDGFGAQFETKLFSRPEKNKLKKLIKVLEKSGCPRRPQRRNELMAFIDWFKNLITTGEGFLPEKESVRKN